MQMSPEESNPENKCYETDGGVGGRYKKHVYLKQGKVCFKNKINLFFQIHKSLVTI